MPIALTPGQAPVHEYFQQQQQQQQQQESPTQSSQQLPQEQARAPISIDAVQIISSPADIPTTSTPMTESTPPPNVTASPISPHPPESFDFTRHYGSSAIDDDDEEDEQEQQRRQQQSHLDGFRNNVGRRDTWSRTILPGRRSLSNSSNGSGIQGLRSLAMTQVNPDPEAVSGSSSPAVSRHTSISSSDNVARPNVSLPATDQGNRINMQPRPPTPPRRNSINSINTRSRSRPQSASASPVRTSTTSPVDAGDDRIRGINDTVSLLRRMLGVENNQDDAIASQALESMERWIQERLARPNFTPNQGDTDAEVSAQMPVTTAAPAEQPAAADLMEGVIMGDPAMQGLDADGNPIDSDYVQVQSPDEPARTTSPASPPTSINIPPRPEFTQFTLATPFSSVGALPPLTPQSEKPPTTENTTSTSASSSGASTPSAVTGTRMTLERGYYSRMERMERRHRRDDEGDCGGGGGSGSCSGGFGAVIAGR